MLDLLTDTAVIPILSALVLGLWVLGAVFAVGPELFEHLRPVRQEAPREKNVHHTD